MSLLPSPRPDITGSQEGAIEIREFTDEKAGDVFKALTADKARLLLEEIYTEPGTTSDLAERAETSIQNTSYHLEKLQEAELIRVAGTQYSNRGKEMKIYAPEENPFVFFIGQESRKPGLLRVFKQAVGAIGVASGVSVLVHTALTDSLPFLDYAGGGGKAAPKYVFAAFVGSLLSLFVYSAVRYLIRRGRPHSDGWPSQGWFSEKQGMADEKALLIGSTFFTASLVFWFARQALGLTQSLFLFDLLPYLFTISIVITAAVSYRRASLQMCWFISAAGFAGTLGHELSLLPLGYANPSEFAVWVGYLVLGAIVGGVMFGSIGFTIGRVVRGSQSYLPVLSS